MYLYVKNVVKELIKNNKEIQKAYIYKNFSDKNLILDLKKRNIRIDYLEKNELDKLANGLHQGIIVSVPNYKYSNLVKAINTRYKNYNETVEKIIDMENKKEIFVIRPSKHVNIKRVEKDENSNSQYLGDF